MPNSLRLAGLALACLLTAASVRAATWTPDPTLGNPAQHRLLYEIGRQWGDTHFDPAAGLVKERIDRPVSQHLTRESASYAFTLLLTGDPQDRTLAERIIRIVLAKQDLRKDQPTYGGFLPIYEDQWNAPTHPDPNYTQFVGLALGQIIDLDNTQGHLLTPDLRRQLDTAFRITVEATIARDVEPGYTNICLISAAVGAAGDKLLNIPGARDFAMSKLEWILTRAQPGATLTEYLCPTYYEVDLIGAYLTRKFAAGPDIAGAARRTIDFLWQDIAASYHAPTFQLAGPHSRAYGEDMLEYAAGLKYFIYLATDGKYPVSSSTGNARGDAGGLATIADLPVHVRPEFSQVPGPWREIIVAGRGGAMAARQFRQGEFVLGSINFQSVWQQQKNVVAYWPVLTPWWHVAFCEDMSPMTFDNAYAHFYSVQNKATVLVALTGKPPVPVKGGLRLGFNAQAHAQPGSVPGSWQVSDGDVVAFIYPVSTQEVKMTTESDGRRTCIERPWASADLAGGTRLLAYILTFQLPGEPPPVVKDVSVKPDGKSALLSANVNGAPLSLRIPQ